MKILDYDYKDLFSLNTVEDILDEIDRVLQYLHDVALTMSPEEAKDIRYMEWFDKRVVWIKTLYSRAEKIIYETQLQEMGMGGTGK